MIGAGSKRARGWWWLVHLPAATGRSGVSVNHPWMDASCLGTYLLVQLFRLMLSRIIFTLQRRYFSRKARLQSGCFLGARAPLRFFAARLKSNARTFWLCDRRQSFFPTSTSTLRDTQSRTPTAIQHLESQHHSWPQIFDSSGVVERCHNVGAEGCEQGGHQVVASLEDGARDGRGSRTTTLNRLHGRWESRCSLSFRHSLRSR